MGHLLIESCQIELVLDVVLIQLHRRTHSPSVHRTR
uniref:Uncharacterized protein n=1 Tax=Anguilla anguilla TaxID=7936 RepID=A0A0E9PJJ6_ANGAN